MSCPELARVLWRSRALLASCVLLTLAAVALRFGAIAPGSQAEAAAPAMAAASEPVSRNPHIDYGHLPLIFEANQGQSHPQVKFLARGAGYGLFFTANETVLSLQNGPVSLKRPPAVLHMQLAGASAGHSPVGIDQLPGHSNYFIGNDPSRWHRNIPQFARIRYRDVYPGIDVVYYGNRGLLEYDFELSPGADPGQINLRFEGAERLAAQKSGDLTLHLQGGDVQLHAPLVYQEAGGKKQFIPARFAVRNHRQVSFAVGAYDREKALVIDPVLSYSSYLGGTGDEACTLITGSALPIPGCPAVTVDSGFNIYLAGSTTSSDFPITPGPYNDPPFAPFQPGLAGTANIFVTKLDPTGTTILFSTYLGGSNVDTSAGIAVDSGLDVDVAGTTTSTNFPVVAGRAFQSSPTGLAGPHVFVSQLDPTGSQLIYSTYLSGNGNESAFGAAVDFRNKIYVFGTTTSTNTPTAISAFPATLGSFQTCSALDVPPAASNCGTNRFFLSKIDTTQAGFTSLAYSTFFSGGNPANAVTLGGGIAVDIAANVYITGGTNYQVTGTASSDFPVLNAYQGCLNTPPPAGGSTGTSCTSTSSNTDAFVAKFNPAASPGSQLIYSTYLGGTGSDVGYGVAVDAGFNSYVTGSTNSTDFTLPTSIAPFQPTNEGGPLDAFLGKFGNPCTGTGCATPTVPLNYFTYLGGSGQDAGLGVAVDSVQGSTGGARIVGYTNSPTFPLTGATNIQPTPGGGFDAFVARIDTTLSGPSNTAGEYATYLGGSGTDYGTAIVTDQQGGTYVTGETQSPNFPNVNPFQSTRKGSSDAFFAKLGQSINLSFFSASASPSQVGVGSPLSFVFIIQNNGDPIQTFTVLNNLPVNGATFNNATASPGSCTTTVVNSTVQCTVGPLSTTDPTTHSPLASINVTINPTAPNPPNTAPVKLTDSASIQLGQNFTSASATGTVNDFTLTVAPSTPPPVVAGAPASMTVTVTPTGNIPNSVALACGSGLPTGASCSFPNGSSIPNLSSGAQSRLLVINTTVRVTTPASLWRSRKLFFAIWLPIAGLAFLGLRTGKTNRALIMALLAVSLTSIVLQVACGTSAPTTSTTGTPAGTYTINVNATSGSAPAQAVRTQQVTLTVQ